MHKRIASKGVANSLWGGIVNQASQWSVVVLFGVFVSACSGESSSNRDDPPGQPEVTTYSLSTEVLAVAKRSGCLACHSVDKQIVGPAWRDVALKYQGDVTAVDSLINKVKIGGKGVWSDVPMPPYSPRVSDVDIKFLITSILGLSLEGASHLPPLSINGTVAVGGTAEHNIFLIEDLVYRFAVMAKTGNVKISIYLLDSTGSRTLIKASQSPGAGEQITLRAPVTGTFVVVIAGEAEPQYTLSINAFDKDQFLTLAKSSGCLACHSIEKKVVGPAFRDVATKYRDDAGAVTVLMTKVAASGVGVWGTVPMPPYSPRVANDDIEALVTFLLTLPDATVTPPIVMPPPTDASTMLELAKSAGCLACHSIEMKVVGPAWIDVANFYRNNADAYANLFAKVKAGGKGVWGEVPMPPYSPRVADASIAQLVSDILALGGPSLPLPLGAWSVVGSVAQGETDLIFFVGDSWTVYTIELQSLTGDADLTVYAKPTDSSVRRLIGKSDLKSPQDGVSFSTEAAADPHDIEVYGYLGSNYGLSFQSKTLNLPDPQPPSAEQFRNYVYTLSDATRFLAKTNGCLACHAETTRVLGPSFKAISLRFKDVAGSKDRLIAKVKAGGKGLWGEIPMPPYSPRVPDVDIETLVQSILFGDPVPSLP